MSNFDKKESILKKIKSQLQDKTSMPYPELVKNKKEYFKNIKPEEQLNTFKLAFEALGGIFFTIDNYKSLASYLIQLKEENNWNKIVCAPKDIFHFLLEERLDFIREPTNDYSRADSDAVITICEGAVARTGSFLFSSTMNKGRTSTILYPNHIVILQKGQIYNDLSHALVFLENKYNNNIPSMLNITTGSSNNYNKTHPKLQGKLGPQQLFCIYIQN